jgi:hypothetical protein
MAAFHGTTSWQKIKAERSAPLLKCKRPVRTGLYRFSAKLVCYFFDADAQFLL